MKIHKTAITPYTKEEMFDLVNDIESYPQFLPGCDKVIVLDRSEREIKAAVSIAKGNFSKSFSTINTINRPNSIMMNLLDGPFSYLEGSWQFIDADVGSEVSDTKNTHMDANDNSHQSKILFNLEFEFKNKIVAMMMGPMITKILESLVDAFCQRAQEIYGKR